MFKGRETDFIIMPANGKGGMCVFVCVCDFIDILHFPGEPISY